jgi:hypothetical protein
MFLGWQIAVCISITVSGFVSLSALRVVSIAWLLWTLIFVLPTYAPWVGVFQLVNIGITFSVVNSMQKESK